MSFGLTADYLGWKPTSGVYGRQFCDPVVHELLDKRRLQGIRLKRHSLEFARKKLKIAELPIDPRAQKPLRYPSIPASDITYVQLEDGRTDPLVFSLILLGFNEESSHSVHVHAWRGRSLVAVSEFVARLNICLTSREHLLHVRERERELLQSRTVEPSGLFGTERPPSAPPVAPSIAASLPAELHSVTEELRQRLRTAEPPLLHPPRDYDAETRSHGNPGLVVLLDPALRAAAGMRTASTGCGFVRGMAAPAPSPPPPLPPQLQLQLLDNDSSDDDVQEAAAEPSRSAAVERLAFEGDLSADPGTGFSTWRLRRMQRRRALLAAVAASAGSQAGAPPEPPPKPRSHQPRRQQESLGLAPGDR